MAVKRRSHSSHRQRGEPVAASFPKRPIWSRTGLCRVHDPQHECFCCSAHTRVGTIWGYRHSSHPSGHWLCLTLVQTLPPCPASIPLSHVVRIPVQPWADCYCPSHVARWTPGCVAGDRALFSRCHSVARSVGGGYREAVMVMIQPVLLRSGGIDSFRFGSGAHCCSNRSSSPSTTCPMRPSSRFRCRVVCQRRWSHRAIGPSSESRGSWRCLFGDRFCQPFVLAFVHGWSFRSDDLALGHPVPGCAPRRSIFHLASMPPPSRRPVAFARLR